jgi:hypothetical protein
MGSLLIIDDDADLCYMLQMYSGENGLHLDAVGEPGKFCTSLI